MRPSFLSQDARTVENERAIQPTRRAHGAIVRDFIRPG